MAKADVIICGAGIAGVSLAYRLASSGTGRRILLLDERPPLSLTSDKSTECYRNLWPGPGDAMVALSNASIDMLESLAHRFDNRFSLNRRGYLFATSRADQLDRLETQARQACGLGAGSVRVHTGPAPDYEPHSTACFDASQEGFDLLRGPEAIRRYFPYLSKETAGVLHARRCGWMSAQQLGQCLLEGARSKGVELLAAKVVGLDIQGGAVSRVRVQTKGSETWVDCPVFVNAAGPFASDVGKLAGLELPLVCEAHLKASFAERAQTIPRNAPLLIWNDPVVLPWTDDERALLAEDPKAEYLTKPFVSGVHGRPEGGGDSFLLYWTFHEKRGPALFPMEESPHLFEILLRGMSRMVPSLSQYFDPLPRAWIDGGYYSKAPDNRPLIGPSEIEGYYLHCGYSGFGIMVSQGASALAAAHLDGEPLPHYESAFRASRFSDPTYLEGLLSGSAQGQL